MHAFLFAYFCPYPIPSNHVTLLCLFFFNLPNLKFLGQKWRTMRPILSPSFTSSKMRSIFKLISECVENFNDYYLKKNQDIVEVEMKDSFTRFANDVIATTAFGVKIDSLKEQNNEFYTMGKEVTDFSSFLKWMKLFGFMLFPKLFSVSLN